MKRTRLTIVLLAALLALSACAQKTPPAEPTPAAPAPVTEPATPPAAEPTPAEPPAAPAGPEQVNAQNFYARLTGEWRCVGGETEGWTYDAAEERVSASLTFAAEGWAEYRYTDCYGNDDGAVIRPEDVTFVDERLFDCSEPWSVELAEELDARLFDAALDGERLVLADRDALGVLFFERVPTEALLTIDFCESREAVQKAFGAVDFYEAEWFDSDEPLAHEWAVVTALRDGTAVTFERCRDNELYTQSGLFLPESVYASLTLDAGEHAAFEVTQPWHPSLRVTAARGARYGSFVFGGDNYLHLENVPRTVSARPYETAAPESEHELRERLAGAWAFEPDGENAGMLSFYYDGTCAYTTPQWDYYPLRYELDRLYAADDEAPDLLRLTTDDEETLAVLPDYFGEYGLGDYLIDLAQCGGEQLLRLTQANNGDAALPLLIPHEGSDYTFLFLRCEGASDAAPTHTGESFPATVWRYDDALGLMWVQPLAAADEDEAGYTLYRADADAAAEPYPAAPGAAAMLAGVPDPRYPAAQFEVTVDAAGRLTALE